MASFGFLCKNYVMNELGDTLYNVYIGKRTTKELWESLDKKYKKSLNKKYKIKYKSFKSYYQKSLLKG